MKRRGFFGRIFGLCAVPAVIATKPKASARPIIKHYIPGLPAPRTDERIEVTIHGNVGDNRTLAKLIGESIRREGVSF